MIYYSLMEEPGKGRANIIHDGMDTVITINARRHPLIIFMCIFFIAWMFGWGFALVQTVSIISDTFVTGDNGTLGFTIVWLLGWICGGLGILTMIIWALMRKETVTVNSSFLRIERKALGIGRSGEYSIIKIKNLRLNRIAEPVGIFASSSWFQGFDIWGTRPGTLAFDYGMRTVNFAKEIDEPEAKYLMELFHKRGIGVLSSEKS
jgi:hypothetical protein